MRYCKIEAGEHRIFTGHGASVRLGDYTDSCTDIELRAHGIYKICPWYDSNSFIVPEIHPFFVCGALKDLSQKIVDKHLESLRQSAELIKTYFNNI